MQNGLLATRNAVRDVLVRLTAYWREGRIDEVAALLHEDVVFVQPGFGTRAEGRAACADTYRQFYESAKVIDYGESNLSIDTWADTAVATYRYLMEWEMAGKRSRETGNDVIVLVCREGRWGVVWRTLVPRVE
jgi:ketosteroid isomerase-like protein